MADVADLLLVHVLSGSGGIRQHVEITQRPGFRTVEVAAEDRLTEPTIFRDVVTQRTLQPTEARGVVEPGKGTQFQFILEPERLAGEGKQLLIPGLFIDVDPLGAEITLHQRIPQGTLTCTRIDRITRHRAILTVERPRCAVGVVDQKIDATFIEKRTRGTRVVRSREPAPGANRLTINIISELEDLVDSMTTGRGVEVGVFDLVLGILQQTDGGIEYVLF